MGDSPLQIKNLVIQTNQKSENPHVATYKYIGKDIEYVAGIKVDNIILSFFKNKLYSIGVNFGDFEQIQFTHNEYTTLQEYLEQSYGDKWLLPLNNEGRTLEGAIWKGKKVTLELFRRGYGQKNNLNDYDYVGGYIHIFENNLNKQLYDSNF